jgi:hypothetical protein
MGRTFARHNPSAEGLAAVNELRGRPHDFIYEWFDGADILVPTPDQLTVVIPTYNRLHVDTTSEVFVPENIKEKRLRSIVEGYECVRRRLAAPEGKTWLTAELFRKACWSLSLTDRSLVGGFLAEGDNPDTGMPNMAAFCSRAIHNRIISDLKPILMTLRDIGPSHVVGSAIKLGVSLEQLKESADFQARMVGITEDVPNLGTSVVMSEMPSWQELTRVAVDIA